jgi:hypothetical protein
VHLYEILYEGGAIIGDLDIKTFNPIASNILEWLRFKFVKWMHYLQYSDQPNNAFGVFSIVGFP